MSGYKREQVMLRDRFRQTCLMTGAGVAMRMDARARENVGMLWV